MALKPGKTSPLQMTPGEICGMFREAKNKIKQIAILAQVNATSKGRIIDILVDNGAELTPVLLGGSAPIRSVTFVREFNAAKGVSVSQVMID